MIRIPQRLQSILREVMTERRPQLLSHFAAGGELSLDAQQRFDVQQSLGDELCETGLKPDDEPNDRGYALEELIDLVGRA
jgi:hypothetical protein